MNARLSFDAELESLSASLIRMGALATDAIDKAIEALEANDGALAQSVIAGDRNIDDMERSIEHQCLTLLLRQQPVAGDLRKISTAIKMITDIERIGDAPQISRRSPRTSRSTASRPLCPTLRIWPRPRRKWWTIPSSPMSGRTWFWLRT